jgi:hypothetical protein
VHPDPSFEVGGIIQPKKSGDTIGVPRSEQSSRNSDEVGKDGNSDRKYEGQADSNETQEDPNCPSQEGMGVDVSSVAEETDKYQFRSSV